MPLKTAMPEVRVLVCKRDTALAIHCLGSLLRYSADPLKLILHDDGSLTPDDEARLKDALPGVSIISKSEANDVVLPALNSLPRLRAFRERNPTGQKLVDVGLFAQGDIIQCDSDVMFFRPFRGLFRWPSAETESIHLVDIADAFCIKPWQTGDLRLIHRFNSGLMTIKRHLFDLETMERMVGFIEESEGYKTNKGYQWFMEQTCWSAIAGKRPAAAWSRSQLRVIARTDRYDPQLVAGHFVGSVRHLMKPFEAAADAAGVSASAPVDIRITEAATYSTPTYLADRFINRARNALGQLARTG